MYYKFGTIKLLGTVKFTFFSTSLSESLPEELEETSSFDLGILKEKYITRIIYTMLYYLHLSSLSVKKKVPWLILPFCGTGVITHWTHV